MTILVANRQHARTKFGDNLRLPLSEKCRSLAPIGLCILQMSDGEPVSAIAGPRSCHL